MEIEKVLELTSISLCLDTGHLLLGGGDPVRAMRDWKSRINHMHLKDARQSVVDGIIREAAPLPEIWKRKAFCRLGDGDLDIVVNTVNDFPQLLRCDLAPGNNWIKVRTIGTKSNRSGIGAGINGWSITMVPGRNRVARSRSSADRKRYSADSPASSRPGSSPAPRFRNCATRVCCARR